MINENHLKEYFDLNYQDFDYEDLTFYDKEMIYRCIHYKIWDFKRCLKEIKKSILKIYNYD